MRLMLALSIALSVLATGTEPVAANGCGMPPMPPMPPLGCRAMRPTCICDARGNCRWEFECVR